MGGGLTSCLATPLSFFLIRLLPPPPPKKKTVRLCDLYRLAGFLLVERFWDVAKRGFLVPEIHSNLPRFFFQFINELDRDGLQDMDYDVMRRVIQCEGKREVWSIINAYNDSVFRLRIQAHEELAQGLVPACSFVDQKKIFFSFFSPLKKRGKNERFSCNKRENKDYYSIRCFVLLFFPVSLFAQ